MRNLFSLALLSILLWSCSNESEPIYSCDETIDKYICENLEEIKCMSRETWLSIEDYELQKSAYSLFNAEQKFEIWSEHLKDVLTLDWNKKEREHIEKFLAYIESRPYLFNYTIDTMENDLADEFDIFVYEWKEYAQMHLGWTRQVMYAIIATPEKMLDKQGTIGRGMLRSPIIGEESGPKKDECSCNIDDDWCDTANRVHTCKSDGCKVTNWFCGTLGVHSCNGNCYLFGQF